MRSLTVRQLLTDVDFIEAVFDDYFYTTEIGTINYAYLPISELVKRVKGLTLLDEKQGIILFRDVKYRIIDYDVNVLVYVPIKYQESLYGRNIQILKELPSLLNVGNCFQFVD